MLLNGYDGKENKQANPTSITIMADFVEKDLNNIFINTHEIEHKRILRKWPPFKQIKTLEIIA